MKTTRFFAAALALLSVLSCQKEEQQVTGNSENKGGTIITCTFTNNDAATKTTLDGLTPKWAAGDKIMLYDGISNIQELTLAASGDPSSEQGIIDSTDATMFAFLKPEEWVDVYAIYPSSACVSGFSASAPKINFAGQDGSFAKANICAAADISDTMSFKNVGAILKFPSKPTTVTDILIPVAGLAKDYTVSFSGRTPSLTPVDASNSKSYSIGSGTGIIYIGVPAGKIAKGSTFTYNSTSGFQGSYMTGKENTMEANKLYTLPAIEANGKLPGVFTVGAASSDYTGKVQFSKGNLYCNTLAAGGSYAFEAYQYDYRHYKGKTGDASFIKGSSGHTPEYTVGSFFFSKDASIAYASTYSFASRTSTDKFFTNDQTTETNPNSNLTVNGSTGLWRALTSAEWTYLLNTRSVNGGTGEGKSYQRATVNTVYGLIIYPDSYTAQTTATSYTSAQWSTMESAGCVFLPAAGRRKGSNVEHVGSYGYYWSSTPNGESFAYYFYFSSGTITPADYDYREDAGGCSVRLVCAAQ